MPFLNSESGRRGNWRWRYGTHGWFPQTQMDFSRGFIRDLARTDIPQNSLWDVQDFLVHLEGALVKRGSTAYAGPAMTAATTAAAVAYAEYPAGSKLIAVGDNGHIYNVTSGATTDVGGVTVTTVDTPKFRIGGTKNLLVFPVSDGTTSPVKYDGTAVPAALGGTPPAGKYCAVYKSRLALGGSSSTPQRVYFSPTPDIESTWDTTNSWVDFDHPITGMCALQNALLVFSAGHTERLIGATPPPNSDMDRQPVGDIGCLDARSIAIYQGNAVFASSRGVFMTNGSTFVSLTGGVHGNDGINDYWQRTVMANYTAGSTILSGGVFKDFYLCSLQNQFTLVCHIPTRSWTRFTFGNGAAMFASQIGGSDELYYADLATNRVGKLSGCFINPSDFSGTGTDADGTAFTPSLQTRAYGDGSQNAAFGHVHVTYSMNDTSPSSTPTILATRNGTSFFGSSTSTTLGTLAATGTHAAPAIERQRLLLNLDAPSVSFVLSQTAASSATVIRAIEVETRGFPVPTEGPSV